MTRIVVLDPVAEPRVTARELSPRLETLSGRRIGFLSNTKPNVTELFAAIETRLRERHHVGAIVHRRKTIAAMPADEAILNALVGECDAVVVAIGD